MRRVAWLLCILVVGSGTLGCHNTGQGIKADARRDVQNTGHAVEKVGRKIEDKK